MPVDTNLTPTRENKGEHWRQYPRRNMFICRSFWTLANNYDVVDPPSHGRGHEFESRRVNSQNLIYKRKT
jgi:hypothetical protein